MSSFDVDYESGMDFGVGVDNLTGSILGKAVEPGEITKVTTSQSVTYFITSIETSESLYESLDISMRASGHYGMFQSRGKFRFSRELNYNSQSSFFVVKCEVFNSFEQCTEARLEESAVNLINTSSEANFTRRYGNTFVRGLQTGGIFYAVISLFSEDRREQTRIAGSLQASFGGLSAGVSGGTSINEIIESSSSRTEFNVFTFQAGGTGTSSGLVYDLDEVYERLQAFPSIIEGSGTPFRVQLASYITLDNYPDTSTPSFFDQRSSLQKYANTYFSYIRWKNDIKFIQDNPSLFAEYQMEDLNSWQNQLSQNITNIETQARKCAISESECNDIPYQLPFETLPERKEVGSDVVLREESGFLGRTWIESEDGWSGIWKRQGDTRFFDAEWHKPGSTIVITSTLKIYIVAAEVRVFRHDNDTPDSSCVYQGTLDRETMKVTGFYSCDWTVGIDIPWEATITES